MVKRFLQGSAEGEEDATSSNEKGGFVDPVTVAEDADDEMASQVG